MSEATSHPEAAHFWSAGPTGTGHYYLASLSDPLWVLLSLDNPGLAQLSPPFCGLPGSGSSDVAKSHSPHLTPTPTPPWPGEDSSGYDQVRFQSFWSPMLVFYSQGIPMCWGPGRQGGCAKRGSEKRSCGKRGGRELPSWGGHWPSRWSPPSLGEGNSKYFEQRPRFREPLTK